MTITRNESGLALIDLLFVVGIIGVLSVIAVPRLVSARTSANSASAIATMRTIGTAQLSFAISCGNGFYAPDLPALAKAPIGSVTGFIRDDLGSAVIVIKSGYTVQMQGTSVAGAPDTCNLIGPNLAAQGYRAGADPNGGVGDGRYFGINTSSVIYEDTASLYGGMPESGLSPSGHPILH